MLGKIIKIAGKREFAQLTWPEFGMMIDAFLDGDSNSFAAIALSEFVGSPVFVSRSAKSTARHCREHALARELWHSASQ